MKYICITNSNSVFAQGKIYHPGDEADFSAKYVNGEKDKDGKPLTADKKKHWMRKDQWIKEQEAAEEARIEAEYAAKNAPAALKEAQDEIKALKAELAKSAKKEVK
jgi:hypothetical protein